MSLPATRSDALTPEKANAWAADAIEAVDRVRTPDEAEAVLRRVKALDGLVRLAEIGRSYEREWRRVLLMAERKYGELLGPLEPGRRSDLEPVTRGNGLGGAERRAHHEARKVAAVPEPVFNAYVTEAAKPSRAGLLRAAQAITQPHQHEEQSSVNPACERLTGQTLMRANSHKSSVVTAVSTFTGTAQGLKKLDLPLAVAVMSSEERDHWHSELGTAMKELRRLRTELKGEHG